MLNTDDDGFLSSVSLKRLRHALNLVIKKNAILRTSYHVDPTTKEWYQKIEELSDEGYLFTESEISAEHYDQTLRKLMVQERKPGSFPMDRPQRIRLHIVRQRRLSDDQDSLQAGDIILLTIRHEAMDGTSLKYFLSDLSDAYKNGELLIRSDDISYLDYTLQERQKDKSASIAYWQAHHRNMDLARFTSSMPSDRP